MSDQYWETEIECIENCSKAPETVTVWIMPLAKVKIDVLMEKFPSIEWLAYLIGDGNDPFTVTDIHIPQQRISVALVDEIVCPEFNSINVIGVIHSHHGMGNGFSGTDHEYINQNHDISLVISRSSQPPVAGQVRWKTPCGSIKIVKAIAKPKINVDGFDKKSFLDEIEEKVKKAEPVTFPGVSVDTKYGFQCQPNNFWQKYSERKVGGKSVIVSKGVSDIAEDLDKELEDIIENGATKDTEDVWESEIEKTETEKKEEYLCEDCGAPLNIPLLWADGQKTVECTKCSAVYTFGFIGNDLFATNLGKEKSDAEYDDEQSLEEALLYAYSYGPN